MNNINNININNIGFIILRHVNSIKTNLYWILCYKSIRKIYGDNYKIVIIDDNSEKEFINNKNNNLELINCEIIESEFPKRGEILPYYYFYKNHFFEKAIIIHDSTFIQQYIDFNLYEDVRFIWHFEHTWDNEIREIDLLNFVDLSSSSLESLYKDKNKWKGCFGCQSVISYNFLQNIAEKYNIFKLLDFIDSRGKRMHFERIFGFLCCIEKDKYNNYNNSISIFGSIHGYIKWGYTFEKYLYDINHKNINKYKIIKVWSGR